MNTLRVLYHLVRADFLERVHRYGFVFTLLAAAYLGLEVVKGDIHLRLDQFRGLFNSAWVGLLMAMTTSTFVSLAGFYLVKNAVERDRQTGVGQILATTPIRRSTYLLGKLLSNLLVLGSIVLVLALAAILTQLTSGETGHLDFWSLFCPFLLLALPSLAFAAGLAVFFETVPWLRGGFGNLLYFVLWISLFSWGLERHTAYADFTGFHLVAERVGGFLRQAQPGYQGGIGLSIGDGDAGLRTFLWPGMSWSPVAVWLRLYWVGIAFGLTLLGAIWFDRFDPARSGKRRWPWRASRVRADLPTSRQPSRVFDSTASGLALTGAMALGDERRRSISELAPAPGSACRFTTVLRAETRLMLKGQAWWWYAGALIFLIASLATPLGKAREELLPFVWLWPVLLWSPMGTRELKHRTSELLFTAPHGLSRQLPAMWLAGVMLACVMGAGIGLKLALAHDWSGLIGWTVGATFIPTAALALGVWSGSSKLFEALFIVCWYIGPIQKVTTLNFMTTSPAAVAAGLPAKYLIGTLLLLLAAVLGRHRAVRRAGDGVRESGLGST